MSDHAKFRDRPTVIRNKASGFTLTEAVMVIVITGILAGMVAVFIRAPVQGFFDTARRAALVDIADTALRRISRDLREALPNSVRVSGTGLEFLHVRSAGRYREQVIPTGGAGAPGDILDFNSVDTTFDVLGPTVNVQSGDSVVIYNLGIPGTASAYDTSPLTTRRVAVAPFGASLSNVAVSSAAALPFSSPARRFQVIDTPVSYVCSGTQMRRYSGYAITAPQAVPPAGTGALIADKIASCSFVYAAGPTQRDALITLGLNLTDGGETVSLIYQVHVSNVP